MTSQSIILIIWLVLVDHVFESMTFVMEFHKEAILVHCYSHSLTINVFVHVVIRMTQECISAEPNDAADTVQT